jgi:predicted ATPase
LLAIEEPENQLYPELLQELAEEFRAYAKRDGQVFVSTHSPDFLNGAELKEIFWLVKRNGFSTIVRATDNDVLKSVAQREMPGALWKRNMFEGAGLSRIG